jgi:hypothetical protein
MTPRTDFPARARRALARCLALVVCTTLAVSACTFDSEPEESTDASSVGPSDANLDLSGLPVPRAAFCDVLAENDVTQALEGPVTDTAHYDNGDEIEVRPGYVDVSHEYGCTFESADGAAAKAWVFARPVTRDEARSLVRRARRGRDCAFPETIGFGTPGLTSVCEVAGGSGQAGRLVRARLEGLFGDSWLGCEVAEPLEAGGGSGRRADVVQRADQWCTEVVAAVAGRS